MAEDSKPGPKPSVTDEELIQVFLDSDDPVLSTKEVTDQVPLARRSVYDRLSALRAGGQLQAKQIGGRNTVWWITAENKTD